MLQKRHLLQIGVACVAMAVADPAFAQEAAAADDSGSVHAGGSGQADPASSDAAKPATTESSGLEDIIVTASKRAENSQRVSAAVTAITGSDLAQDGITDQTKLEQSVPSLVVGAKGGITGLVFLRGIGQTVGASNAQDGVAVNFNGVFLQREIGVSELFDLDRVEVLPGPQGTLYGGSAAGGIINYQTARPTDVFEGSVSFEAGNYGLVHTIGVLNLPVSDTFAVRVAGNYNRHDGYESNGLDDAENVNGRLTAIWRPTADLSILGLVQYDHRGGKGPGNQLKGPGVVSPFQKPSDPWYNSYPTDGLFIKSNDVIAMIQADYHFADNLNLSYIGSYSHIKSDNVMQFQFLYGSPLQTTDSSFPVRMTQYSQELRLSNDAGGRSNWIAGLYWAKSSHFFGLNLPEPTPFISATVTNELRNYAAYGQYSYSLKDELRLVAGARISSDRFNGGGAVTLPPALGGGYDYGGAKTEQHFDWKVGVEYDVRPHSMAYFTVQTGFVQGGYTQTPIASGLPRILKPATLLSYTAGIKNRFLDNTLQINNEIFYYDYKDLQQQLLQGAINIGVNFPKTKVFGNQLDVNYLATPNDELSLGVMYLSARVKSGTLPGFTTNFRNFQLPGAPTWTISAGYRHDFELARGSKITFDARSYFNSGYWGTFTHDQNSHQKSYTKTDLSLTYYAPARSWSIGAFVRNIENSAVYSACAGASAPGDPVGCYLQAPRTFGARLEGHF